MPDEMRVTRFMFESFSGPDMYVAILIGADDVHLECVYILLMLVARLTEMSATMVWHTAKMPRGLRSG